LAQAILAQAIRSRVEGAPLPPTKLMGG